MIKNHLSKVKHKLKEKKRSIHFKRKPLPGLQEGHYDNTNLVYIEYQPKSILKKNKNKSVKSLKNRKTKS